MPPKVSVLCSDSLHPVWPLLAAWCKKNNGALASSVERLQGGDLLILVSCSERISKAIRDRYTRSVVIHESDLPRGRGWSPLAWQVLEGAAQIIVSLIECADPIDSGAIWTKQTLHLQGHELAEEINQRRDECRLALMDYALANFATIQPARQIGDASYYPRRTPEDSRINPWKPIADQFDLLRICEPRFPAFFEFRGHRYEITLKKK